MKAGSVRPADERQLDLYEPDARRGGQPPRAARPARPSRPRCARCRAKEARYGFRDEELLEAPRTLCFECFRLEIVRRQERAERLACARNAAQPELPISERLTEIARCRRRAQIAARRALGI